MPLILLLLLLGAASAEERASEGARREAPKEASAEKAPAGIKDRVAVWVFLTWVWGTTIVSIAFLMLKIRECDRLHAMAFQEASRTSPQEKRRAV